MKHSAEIVQLIEALQNEDENAFKSLYWNNRDAFMNWARSKFPRTPEVSVEDIYHDVLD